MGNRQPLFVNTSGLPEEMADTDVLDLGGLNVSTGNIVLAGGSRITGLVYPPLTNNEAVSKQYVDSVINGLDPKESCRLKTTTSLIAAGWTVAGSGIGKTLTSPDALVTRNMFDSVTSAIGNRILVSDGVGAAAVHNGIYVVTQLADTILPAILERALDFDENNEVDAGAFTFVTEGTLYQDTGWLMTTDDVVVLETTQLVWSQFSGANTMIGGAGITVTGSTIDVDLATNPALEFDVGGSAGKLRVLVDPVGAIDRLVTGLKSRVDGTTITINGSNQLAVSAQTAGRVEAEVTANENVVAGDPVYWKVANEVGQGRANTNTRINIVGVMEDTVAAAGVGTMVRTGPCLGVISGATAGDAYFLDTTGGVSVTPPTGSGHNVVRVGFAKNATDLDVQIQYIGRRAA